MMPVVITVRILQSMFDYLDNAVIKLCEMTPVGTDLGTVKHQIEELKVGIALYHFGIQYEVFKM